MKVLSLVTQKGGSGKSTIARHLAVAFHLSGKRTVVLDCDMQGGLRDWGEIRSDPAGTARDAPKVIVELSPVSRHIQGVVSRLAADGVEVLVVDTPGGLQTPVPYVLAGLSDLVLVPLQPTADDLNAFWPLATRLRESGATMVVILSRCPTTTTRPRVGVQSVLVADGIDVAPVAIHEKRIVPDSGATGLTVFEMDATSEAEQKTVQEFRDLHTWASDKLGAH